MRRINTWAFLTDTEIPYARSLTMDPSLIIKIQHKNPTCYKRLELDLRLPLTSAKIHQETG